MMPTRKPHNATPQRVDLRPLAVNYPRMPFSSPMAEEIVSPASTNPSRTPPQDAISNRRGLQEQDTQISRPDLQISKETKGKSGMKREESTKVSKWSGLNLVTTFPRPQAAAGPDKNQDGLTSGRGLRRSGRLLKSSGSKNRLDDLKRASSKVSNLSPSDRAVVIGISPEDMIEQGPSPDDRSFDVEQYARERRHSVTPSIVITPARDQAPWSASDRDTSSPIHERPASSIYSQKSPAFDSSSVPPVPPLPPEARAQNANLTAETGLHPRRVLSSCTVFDEDDVPTRRSHPDSSPSQIRILQRSTSMDTIATRHLSQGWWNYIISPFLPRSPMTFGRKNTDEDIPPLPVSNKENASGRDRPIDSKPTGSKSAHTSFTDSTFNTDFEKDDADIEISVPKSVTNRALDEAPARPISAFPTPFAGLGAAAEYFEGCLYDMHSPTPFFECVNHACRPSTVNVSELPTGTGINDGGRRGLSPEEALESSSKEQPNPNGPPQVPSNRFSAAFREAMGSTPRTRSESQVTVIEDLDTTPDVREARVAPVVKAPEPIPATQRSGHGDIEDHAQVVDKSLKVLPASPRQLRELPRQVIRPSIEVEEQEEKEKGDEQDGAQEHRDVEDTPKILPANPRSYTARSSSTKEKPMKRYIAVMPPEQLQPHYEEPMSPEPPTPGAQRQVPRDAIVLAEVSGANHGTQVNDRRDSRETTTVADLYPPPRDPGWHDSRDVVEKDELPTRERKSRKWPEFGACLKRRKAKRREITPDEPRKKKKKRLLITIALALLAMIILILALAMTLTRKGRGESMPVQSQWLNITGYPPVPTGISTIAQPEASKEDSDCVQPSTMWSCALPKEQQQNIAPNAPDQPNFRVEIVFQNGTNATTGNNTSVHRRSRGVTNPVSAGAFIKTKLRQIRDSFSDALYTPSPAPPSTEDQVFLGNTTDGNSVPFDGESTPFFMTFESATPLPSRLRKRDSNTNSSSSFPDISSAIPPPSTNPDGTAAPANLYPFPSAQPLRLYNRGLPTEHYGFYTYFDRSIFLKTTAPLNATATNLVPIPDDENGGSPENAASVRCTWSQTRFLVQIWTNKGNPAPLLPGNTTTSSTSSSTPHPTPTNPNNPTTTTTTTTNLTTSSANDFTRPGSFPYPITLTLDRHGGDITKKMIFCYGLDENEKPITSEKKFQVEDRGVGLVNPARGPLGHVNVTVAEGGPGGIDGGGEGGCGCVWRNWV